MGEDCPSASAVILIQARVPLRDPMSMTAALNDLADTTPILAPLFVGVFSRFFLF